MKVAIIFSDGIKQLNFTPENDDEKRALKLITVNDNIELAIKTGSFGEDRYKPFTVDINQCCGGYLRAFEGTDSVMLVLSPKQKAVESTATAEEIANSFTQKELQAVAHLLSDDYEVGFKEGIKRYIEQTK